MWTTELLIPAHSNQPSLRSLMVSKTIYHYVYRITNLVEKKHYYGKRSSKCDPKQDLGKIYFSSSTDKEFKVDQKLNPQNYRYKILQTFSSGSLAIARESKLHYKFNVGSNPKFYNRAKQTPKGFDSTGVPKVNLIGKPRSLQTRQNISAGLKGKMKGLQKSQKHIMNLSGEKHHSFKGYYVSPEAITTTARKQEIFGIFDEWYKKLDKLISRNSYGRSKYLNTKWTWDEIRNKTFRDIGFNFIPK